MRHVMKVKKPRALPGESVKRSGRLGYLLIVDGVGAVYRGSGARLEGCVVGAQSQLAREARRTLGVPGVVG